MHSRSELLEGLLGALDTRFAAFGFRRRRGEQDWRGQIASGLAACLHLNVGKNPDPLLTTVNVGLAIPSLEAALQDAGYRPLGTERSLTFGRTLGTFESRTSGRDAPTEDIANCVWTLWVEQGRAFLQAASDLSTMALALRSPDPHAWPCPSRSHRARLLPVTLWELGDHVGALAALETLAGDMGESDQLRPSFAAFSAWLRNKAKSAV